MLKGPKGGGTTCFEEVLMWVLEALAILKGGVQKSFHPLKGEGQAKFYPVLMGAPEEMFPHFVDWFIIASRTMALKHYVFTRNML